MSGDWEPEQYQDEFRERLHKVIKERMKAHGVVKREEDEPEIAEHAATNVVDFMSLLQQSIDRKKRTPAKKASRAAPAKAAKAPAKKAARKPREEGRHQDHAAQVGLTGGRGHEPARIRPQASRWRDAGTVLRSASRQARQASDLRGAAAPRACAPLRFPAGDGWHAEKLGGAERTLVASSEKRLAVEVEDHPLS